jgi:cell division protease FtsH
MADNDPPPSPENDGDRPDLRVGPAPLLNLVLWAIVLLAIPFGLIMWAPNRDNAVEISQSAFEQALRERRVQNLVIHDNPARDSRKVVGKYLPAGIEGEAKEFVAVVIWSERLDVLIANNCPDKRKVKPVNNLLTNLLVSIVPIVLLIIVIYILFARQIKSAGKSAIQFGKSRAKMNQSTERVTFADLAGVDEAMEEVEEIIDFLRDPERFHRLGGRLPRGVLMIGPPGTGKTLLARAIAGEADVPFYNISGSDFVEMFVGVGASRVRDMFEQAKKDAPCIIFIDEIDAVGRSRFSGIGGGHDEREQTLNALLVEMDGFEGKTGVIVIAATNRPDVLDPALLRPGRFDRQINVDLPDVRGRLGILKVHAKRIKISENVDLELVARGTPGFSGADLANVINEAALLAARCEKNAVTMIELEEARDKICWGKERRSRQIDEKERQVTAYHEAGHALVGLHCEHSTPLHKVTIIPRGMYMGATFHLPQQDRYTRTRSELVDEITVLMGGRFAEELVFDEITSGAAMDIQQATSIARRMVCEWGMSEKVGLLSYGGREEHIYLGRDIVRHDDYSELTARSIDAEIKLIIDTVAARAKTILTDHNDQLMALGKALLEHETMDVNAIKQLLDMPIDEQDWRFFADRGKSDGDADSGASENADSNDADSAASEASEASAASEASNDDASEDAPPGDAADVPATGADTSGDDAVSETVATSDADAAAPVGNEAPLGDAGATAGDAAVRPDKDDSDDKR